MMRPRSIARSLLLLVALALSATQCSDSWPAARQDGSLTVVYPTEAVDLVGGQSLRVTAYLVDRDGQPVEGATAQAELRSPNGAVFATLTCINQGRGRYLADYIHLPLRGAGGTWRVTVRATWNGGQAQAQATQTFTGGDFRGRPGPRFLHRRQR
jgi:hypothetical protein